MIQLHEVRTLVGLITTVEYGLPFVRELLHDIAEAEEDYHPLAQHLDIIMECLGSFDDQHANNNSDENEYADHVYRLADWLIQDLDRHLVILQVICNA